MPALPEEGGPAEGHRPAVRGRVPEGQETLVSDGYGWRVGSGGEWQQVVPRRQAGGSSPSTAVPGYEVRVLSLREPRTRFKPGSNTVRFLL